MSAAINLIVAEVHVDSIEVTRFGALERDVVGGPTTVVFSNGSDRIDFDWTYRGPPPEPGSKWTLAPVEASS